MKKQTTVIMVMMMGKSKQALECPRKGKAYGCKPESVWDYADADCHACAGSVRGAAVSWLQMGPLPVVIPAPLGLREGRISAGRDAHPEDFSSPLPHSSASCLIDICHAVDAA